MSVIFHRPFARGMRLSLSEPHELKPLERVERYFWIGLAMAAYPFLLAWWFRDQWMGWLRCHILHRHTWTGGMVEDGFYYRCCGYCLKERRWHQVPADVSGFRRTSTSRGGDTT